MIATRAIWAPNRRGEAPSEDQLRAELQRLGWELVGHDAGRGGWVARRRDSSLEVCAGWPEMVATLAARGNSGEGCQRDLFGEVA